MKVKPQSLGAPLTGAAMIEGVNHLTLSVRDLDLSFAFYRDVLAFRPLARWRSGAYLLAGEAVWLCLTWDPTIRRVGTDEYTHIAFSIAQADFLLAVDRIRAAGVQEWRHNSSEGDSLYFLDPNGHKLELHVGSWRSRLQSCRARPYEGMVFY